MKHYGVLMCVLLSWRCPATAQKGPQDFCADADVVAVGTVTPPAATADRAFVFTVDRSYKGPLSTHARIVVSWPGSILSVRAVRTSYVALLFLRSVDAAWHVLPIGGINAPLVASGLPVSMTAGAPEAISAGDCEGAVIGELLRTARTAAQKQVSVLSAEALLAGFRTDSRLMSAAEELSNHAVPDVRAVAMASRIRRQESDGLVQAEAELDFIAQTSTVHLVSLALLEWRSAERRGVNALGRIANSKTHGLDQLRLNAANSLMLIHTIDAVPFIAGLLNSPNAQVRQKAVMGLSLFVKGVPILTSERTRAMEFLNDSGGEYLDAGIAPFVEVLPLPVDRLGPYVAAWQAWWARMSQRIGAKVTAESQL